MKLYSFNNKKQGNRKRWLYLIIIKLVIFMLADYLFYLPRIYPGVHIHRFELGSKTQDEMNVLPEEMKVFFTGPRDKYVEVSLSELGINPEIEQLFEDAYQKGRIKNSLPDYLKRWNIMKKGAFIPLQFHINRENLQQQLSFLKNTFDSEPENAYFRVNYNKQRAELVMDHSGYRLNKDALLRKTLALFNQPEKPLVLIVPLTELPAEITTTYYREKGIEKLMTSFSTEFKSDNPDRAHNIKLATSHLDNYILAPGKVFSLNSVIGNTTAAKGYKEAPVIIGGVLSTGIGGGICQISSTLYNAVLLADLPVLERHNHRLTIPYLPPGRDATVEYGSRDFMFRNSTEHHIMIKTEVLEDSLIINLLGQSLDKDVLITRNELDQYSPPTRYKYDPELEPGEEVVDEGTPGCFVEVWKTVYRDGEEISRHKISVDSYRPTPTVIWQGPPANNQ